VSGRVTATDRALEAIERLTADHGKLMFVQSGGCCDGSSPVCLRDGELLVGPNDLLLGEVGGASFFIDEEQYERWRRPVFLLDVGPGAGHGFSLEEREGFHFVVRTPEGEARS
jgi:uncharacterized protein